MLPILKKQEASVVSSPQTIRRQPDEDSEFDSLEVAAQDLCDAVHSRNYKAAAQALRAAFEMCQSEPEAQSSDMNKE